MRPPSWLFRKKPPLLVVGSGDGVIEEGAVISGTGAVPPHCVAVANKKE